MEKINLIGERFARLMVISEAGKKGKHIVWRCDCDCGNSVEVTTTALRQGKQLSCGCLRNEKLIERSETHGATKNYKRTKEYRSWTKAKSRCNNPNDKKYYRYGARGIKLCNRWENSFSNFLEDMGISSLKTSLERVDLNGGYEPKNCVWADAKTQMNNTSKNIKVRFNNKVKTLAQWADEFGIKYKRFHYFYHKKKKTFEEIINEYR